MNIDPNANVRPLHCDVLPLHPPLEEYESLTSYCVRIGQENCATSVSSIANLLFPKSARRLILNLSDLPPMDVSVIAIACNQSESRILESTFSNIGRNFGRSNHPHALARFLKGAIHPFLNYCPLCLQEKPYYSLLWRFIHIKCCEKHKCNLLDSCPHCGNRLPLFSTPFQIGICPKCNYDLRLSNVEFVNDSIYWKNSCAIDDLKLFLSSQDYPYKFNVGNLLKIYRLSKNISLTDVARTIKASSESIGGFEHNNKLRGIFNFEMALKYLGVLNISFREIMEISTTIMTCNNDEVQIQISTKKKGYLKLLNQQILR
jgi:transcriptional regulator with XRE-family HTH domain